MVNLNICVTKANAVLPGATWTTVKKQMDQWQNDSAAPGAEFVLIGLNKVA